MFQSASDTQKGSFAIVCACIWIGIFNSIRSICAERAIVKREHRTGLRISSYIFAHVLFEAFICLVESALITVIIFVRNLGNIPFYGILLPSFLEFFLDFYLITFCADLLGLLVSCIVKDENSAMTVMPFILIAEMVFSGAIFELEDFTQAISALMFSRWGLAAICVTANVNDLSFIYENNDFTYTMGHQLWLWGIILLCMAVFVALSIVFLSLVDRDKR